MTFLSVCLQFARVKITLHTKMPTDKHILVNNEYTEHRVGLPYDTERPPVYSERQSRPVETVVGSEKSHQSRKTFLCMEAHKGWTILYSVRFVGELLLMIISAIIYEMAIEKVVEEEPYSDEEEVRKIGWILFWIYNIGNVVFFICFGLLMYGIHGKSKSRHGFFFPMIIFEWIRGVGACVFILGIVVTNIFTRPQYIISGVLVGSWLIMKPIYLNRYRVYVKEISSYSSFV